MLHVAGAAVEHRSQCPGDPGTDAFERGAAAHGVLHTRLGQHVFDVEGRVDRQWDLEALAARQDEPCGRLRQERWRERLGLARGERIARRERGEPGVEPIGIDELAIACGLPIHNVLATLSVLEMRRLIRRLGGNRVKRNY